MLLEGRLPLRYIVEQVKFDVLAVVLVGLATHFVGYRFRNFLPEIPLPIPAFLGTAISVLLSFKMNQSYDRWWEARKVWGAIVNDSRTFVIQLQGLLLGDDNAFIRSAAYRQIAFCYSLGQALRGAIPSAGIDYLLNKDDLETLNGHSNKSLAILQMNAFALKGLRKENRIDKHTHLQLDQTILRLCDSMGKAERIKGTVFPSTYRKYLHFIIYVFLITLSISLKNFPVVFEVPLLLLVSIGFFLIEKSALYLQDPFSNAPSDVPVTAIAQTIEINIRQLLGEEIIPVSNSVQSYYVM
jgi:ion channel-forming bestrophin family protein